jgi:hypothetical protein
MVGVYHRGNLNMVRTWPPVEAGELVTEDPDEAIPAEE